VAGAAVPLFPSADGSTALEEGTPPGGLIILPGGDPAEGDPSFPPVDLIPGGGGGPLVIVPGGGGGGGGGAGTPIDPGAPPVSPIPEPSTWASLATGLMLLALVVRRQRRAVISAAGAPKCATQKRS
jgi:hypothetical protein